MDVDVDIDLGREGRANKISRRQVGYFDFLDMVALHFFSFCLSLGSVSIGLGSLNLESASFHPSRDRYLTTLPVSLCPAILVSCIC